MSYQNLIKKNLLKKENVNFDQIKKVLERAHKNLKSAKLLLENNDEEGAFKFAYEAMLLSGRALIFSYGLRPRTIGSHKTVVDFTKEIFGKEYGILTNKFDKIRKRRHDLTYGVEFTTSSTESVNAIDSAHELISKIEKHIQEKNPQKKLFVA